MSTCVETGFDDVLKDRRAPAVITPTETFSVYVVELDEAVCHRTGCASRLSGKPHVYVGETRQTPEERLAEHLAGGFTSVSAVRNHGIRLRPRLYRNWGPDEMRGIARCRSQAGQEAPQEGFLRQRRPLTDITDAWSRVTCGASRERVDPPPTGLQRHGGER